MPLPTSLPRSLFDKEERERESLLDLGYISMYVCVVVVVVTVITRYRSIGKNEVISQSLSQVS